MRSFILSLLMLLSNTLLAHADSRPNIILFLIDDQNIDQIACYGGKTYTPNLDLMAKEGMKFNRAHVSSAVCTPSRYTWLTGRYAGSSYSKKYYEDIGGKDHHGFINFNMALEKDCMNLPRVLSSAGYATGFTGKFHLSSELDWPEFFEKDGYHEIPRDAKESPEITQQFIHNELVMRKYLQALGFTWAKNIYPENMQKPFNEHNPDWNISAALEFIESHHQQPFYLHITPTLLHGGNNSWKRSFDYPLMSGVGILPVAPHVMTPRDQLLDSIRKQGFDLTSNIIGEAWIDDALGAVLKKLKSLNIDQNTLLVFAPDHGRDGKGALFTYNSTQIPLLARWPAYIPPGSVCDELVQNIDWAPTCFDLAQANIPEGYLLHGQSLKPLLKTGSADHWRDHLYFEMGHARAISTKEWKYISVRYPQETVDKIKKIQTAGSPTPHELSRQTRHRYPRCFQTRILGLRSTLRLEFRPPRTLEPRFQSRPLSQNERTSNTPHSENN